MEEARQFLYRLKSVRVSLPSTMRVLLTGASGFIGKNFLELAPKDIEIMGIYNSSRDIINFAKEKKLENVRLHKCDLTNENEAKELFGRIGKDFEYCIF